MNIQYDKEADALYIQIKRGGRIDKTLEKGDNFLLDVDKNGNVLGIEILNYSKLTPSKDRLRVSIGSRKTPILIK